MTATAIRPLRLVLLLEDLTFGGTQRYALQLAAHLDRSRFAAEIWTLRGGRDHADYVAQHKLKIVDLTDSRRVGPRAIFRLFLSLRASRPALLYTLTVIPNIWGRLLAGLLRIPLVSGYRNHRPRQFEGLLHRLSNCVITNAERLRTTLIDEHGVPAEKIAVIPNGVDTERFRPHDGQPVREPRIVCVARRVPRKDLPTLVEAFQILRRDMPDARLDIIGDGPVTLPAVENMTLLPGSTDIPEALSRARVFALSSIDEGAPNAILEAMAAGLPVVATAAGGVADIVEDGLSGRVVPPRDPVALSRALGEVLSDAPLCAAMGRAARAAAIARYSITAMVQDTERVFLAAARREFPQAGQP